MRNKAPSSQKILYILRHAKAEPGAASQDDHDRVLTLGGEEAAGLVGQYLARRFHPDKVLCSTAMRTRQTWQRMQEAYLRPPPVEYSEKLYLTSEKEILKLVAGTAENIASLLVVGHNPSLHQLCMKLARKGDERLLDTIAIKFPTCAFAAIALGEKWQDSVQAEGTLMAFVTPKMLAADAEE